MPVTQITTHVADAIDRLLQEYKTQPRIVGMLTALVTEFQNIENALFPMPTQMSVTQATGATLDNIGTIVGAKRNGLTDDQYRSLILGTIGVNTSDGTMESLIAIIKNLFEASAVFVRTPNSDPGTTGTKPTATISFGVGSPAVPSSLYGLLAGLLQSAVSAGICIDSIFSFNATKTFSMDGTAPWVGGFDDGTGTVGGGFADKVYQNPSA